MGFPNTAYQPGQAVWYINQYDEPQQSEVEEVIWTKDAITYRIEGRSSRYDMDDLYPSEEVAQAMADDQKERMRAKLGR